MRFEMLVTPDSVAAILVIVLEPVSKSPLRELEPCLKESIGRALL